MWSCCHAINAPRFIASASATLVRSALNSAHGRPQKRIKWIMVWSRRPERDFKTLRRSTSAEFFRARVFTFLALGFIHRFIHRWKFLSVI